MQENASARLEDFKISQGACSWSPLERKAFQNNNLLKPPALYKQLYYMSLNFNPIID